MTWFNHSRRAASVLLVMLCLVAVPAVASATFSASKASGLGVGTDQMEAPTGITGSYRCSTMGATESLRVTTTGFTDAGPSGPTYDVQLALGSTVNATASSTSKNQVLNGSVANDGVITTWTFGIRTRLSSWTSTMATLTITCKANGTDQGSL
jgi:hypothetical protein